jgi:uncharacterized protein with ATP-grasp and redox domains
MTSEPGSFARHTIVERKPRIIEQVLEDHAYPPEIRAMLDAFRREIAQEPVQLLADTEPDAALWNGELAPYAGNTWLEIPWYLAEAYFYRRLLGAVGYFETGPWQNHDPFGPQKRAEERLAANWLADNWHQLDDIEPLDKLEVLLHSSLWGNRADLSNFGVGDEATGGLATREERQRLLIDHTAEVVHLLAAGVERVDFVNDNTGKELMFDLALAEFLLTQGWAGAIVLHLKDRPFFVSDAMPADVESLLVALVGSLPAQGLMQHLAAGRLYLRSHPFWTGPLMFEQMPATVRADLGGASLVIIKGDVNYRRLLDDRHWPTTTALEELTSYFPAPHLVLRTLKSEIMVSLRPGQATAIAAQDPDWLINGKRGIIELVDGAQ